jgi:hypothetical protein
MADQNSRVGRERIGMPADDSITGRESTDAADRAEQNSGSHLDEAAEHATRRYRKTPSRGTAPDRTRAIRAEIEQTREDMSETVNEIQDRLSPSTIAANAVDTVKDAARDRVHDVADSETVRYVRANPIPTTMIGIGVMGLAWLAFGRGARTQPRARVWRDTRDWRGQSEYGTASDYPTTGAESSSVAYSRAVRPDAAARMMQNTTRSAGRAQTSLRRAWQENPLLIGAAAAALGGIVAASLPETDSENRLMGETRNQMIEGVQQAVKGKVEEVQNAATSAVNQVQKAVGLGSDADTPDNNQD